MGDRTWAGVRVRKEDAAALTARMLQDLGFEDGRYVPAGKLSTEMIAWDELDELLGDAS
jgi:hypothetical protein